MSVSFQYVNQPFNQFQHLSKLVNQQLFRISITFSLSHYGQVFIMSASFSMSVSHFAKCQPILTCQQGSFFSLSSQRSKKKKRRRLISGYIPVSPSHEQVFITSASFSMSVSPFFKMGANFNMSAIQYASQSKT